MEVVAHIYPRSEGGRAGAIPLVPASAALAARCVVPGLVLTRRPVEPAVASSSSSPSPECRSRPLSA